MTKGAFSNSLNKINPKIGPKEMIGNVYYRPATATQRLTETRLFSFFLSAHLIDWLLCWCKKNFNRYNKNLENLEWEWGLHLQTASTSCIFHAWKLKLSSPQISHVKKNWYWGTISHSCCYILYVGLLVFNILEITRFHFSSGTVCLFFLLSWLVDKHRIRAS